METTTRPAPSITSIGRVLGLCLGVTLIVGVLTLAFALPSANMGPNAVPIAVVGPDEATTAVTAQLDAAEPDGFEVTAVASADEVRTMIEEREVYGAVEVGPEGVTAYTATAASPMVARLITGIADQIAAGQGAEATVEDVVALPAEDPNGAGLAASALPMAAGGLIIAALLGLNVRGSGRQVIGAIVAPLAVSALIAAILRYWLGSIDGDYWYITGAISLTLLAASWTVLGLTKLLGRAGMIIGAVAIMLIGNPLSGLTSAPELLPAPWGEVGQYLTPGAGATLLRSVSFFDGYGAQTAVVVLGSWLAAGIVLFVLGAVRSKVTSVDDRAAEPAAAAA